MPDYEPPRHGEARWWSPFTATTPTRQRLSGWICKRRDAGHLSGALVVREIDGAPTDQLLAGMPEIPYVAQAPLAMPRQVAATFTRKIDGTALLFSPLTLPNGRVISWPRTRGMPVLVDTRYRAWRTMVDELVGGPTGVRIAEACARQKSTLVFELYGARNRHCVSYNVPLALALHTLVRGPDVLPWPTVEQVARVVGVNTAPKLKRMASPKLEDVERAGELLAATCEMANDPERGVYREEGVVLTLEGPQGGRQWKFKPPSMAEYHRVARRKIRPITIRSEAYKLLETTDEDVSLERLGDQLERVYGGEAVAEARSLIDGEYWSWRRELNG